MVKGRISLADVCFPFLLLRGGINWPLRVEDIFIEGRKERGTEPA